MWQYHPKHFNILKRNTTTTFLYINSSSTINSFLNIWNMQSQPHFIQLGLSILNSVVYSRNLSIKCRKMQENKVFAGTTLSNPSNSIQNTMAILPGRCLMQLEMQPCPHLSWPLNFWTNFWHLLSDQTLTLNVLPPRPFHSLAILIGSKAILCSALSNI